MPRKNYPTEYARRRHMLQVITLPGTGAELALSDAYAHDALAYDVPALELVEVSYGDD